MTSNAITIRNLGKRYILGSEPRPSQIREILANPKMLWRNRHSGREHWALREVSLDIPEGMVTGVIGRNGAGKSTLLKILSRITEPSTGEARVYGRIASLLEVGTGFHPELTGRENIFLNGSILGMSRANIRKNFDAIVNFAEIETHLDTPVKRYSSGMYVRLAFAVAAHLDPDILLVDEVLAVGDARFQRKCLSKIQEIGMTGRSVIVVSHNMDTVARLCSSVAWLVSGQLKEIGPAAQVVGRYLGEGVTTAAEWRPEPTSNSAFAYHFVRIARADRGENPTVIPADVGIAVEFEFEVKKPLPPGRLALRVDGEDGRAVMTSSSTDAGPTLNDQWLPGRNKVSCAIPSDLLPPGRYFLSISEPTEAGNLIHDNVLSFTITEQGSLVSRDGRSGAIAPLLRWTRRT